MTGDRPADYLVNIVRELCTLSRETEWVEFKVNESEPQAIGECGATSTRRSRASGTR